MLGKSGKSRELLNRGAYSKTELVKRVMTEYAITRQRIHKLLERYETPVTLGGQWLVNVSDKNRHTYINYTNGNEDN